MDKQEITDTNVYTPYSIRTNSGLVFDYEVMDPNSIIIEDIAHALAFMPRFAGHTHKFYSVAQHSLLVMDMVPDNYKLDALLHDATEAYMMDIPSPLKKLIPEYKAYENKLASIIDHKFNVMTQAIPIKKADQRALQIEIQDFHLSTNGRAWFPFLAKARFLDAYYKLTNPATK